MENDNNDITITVELPKEVVRVMKKRGYKPRDWILLQVNELLEEVRQDKIKAIIENRIDDIDNHLLEVKGKIKVAINN